MNTIINSHKIMSNSWKGKLLLYSGITAVVLFLIEVFSYGALVFYYKLQERDINLLHAQLLIGSPFLNNPAVENSTVPYIGHMAGKIMVLKWRTPDALLGWKKRKNASITYHHGNAEGLGWMISNPQGFSTAGKLSFTVDQKKQPGVFRIIFIGGSSVEGYGVLNPLENLPSYFLKWAERNIKLPKGYNKIEVINAGVAGYNSAQDFIYFASELIYYNPNLLISFSGGNEIYLVHDLPENSKVQRYFGAKNILQINEHLKSSYTLMGSLGHVLETGFRFADHLSYRLASLFIVKRLFEKTVLRKEIRISIFQGKDEKIVQNLQHKIKCCDFSEEIVLRYEKNIRDIIALARSSNIKFLYFLQPHLGVDGRKYFGVQREWIERNQVLVKKRKTFYASFRHMIRRLQASYQDSSEICITDPSASFASVKDRIFSDSVHLNARGNEIAAQLIGEQILKCGMI